MKKCILIICIMLLMMTTYALATNGINPNRLIEEGYKNPIYMEEISDSDGNFTKVIAQVTILLGVAGIGIGTCVGFIYAIMWITATPSKKADLKERAFPLVIGVILLFGGPGIAATFISAMARMLQMSN